MGVLNVTPDSFSDGGRWFDAAAAVAHGLALPDRGRRPRRRGRRVHPPRRRPGAGRRGAAPGAAGRRGAQPPRGAGRASTPCAPRSPWPRSSAGAVLVNDVSGGLADPAMLPRWSPLRRAVRRDALARSRRRWRSWPSTTTWSPTCGASCARGSTPRSAPGSTRRTSSSTRGSASPSTADHNWRCSRTSTCCRARPSGARRRLPQAVPRRPARRRTVSRPAVDERDAATDAVSALAAAAGVWCVRVHDVGGSLDAVRSLRPGSGYVDAHGQVEDGTR